MLGFPSILVDYTSESHWCPVNPSHLMDPNLKPAPRAVSCPSGWAVLLTSCCSIPISCVQVASSPPDIQIFFLLPSCFSIPTCPIRGCTHLLPACHLSWVPFSHQAVTGSDLCLGWATPQSKVGSCQMRKRSRKKTPAENLNCIWVFIYLLIYFSYENTCFCVRKSKRHIFGTQIISVQYLGILLPNHWGL